MTACKSHCQPRVATSKQCHLPVIICIRSLLYACVVFKILQMLTHTNAYFVQCGVFMCVHLQAETDKALDDFVEKCAAAAVRKGGAGGNVSSGSATDMAFEDYVWSQDFADQGFDPLFMMGMTEEQTESARKVFLRGNFHVKRVLCSLKRSLCHLTRAAYCLKRNRICSFVIYFSSRKCPRSGSLVLWKAMKTLISFARCVCASV